MPSWRTSTPESGLVVAMLPLLYAVPRGQSCPTACVIEPSGSRRGNSWAASRIAALEDRIGHEAADDPIRRVDDLADLQVAGERAQDVGVRARQSPFAPEVVDHRPHGLARRLHQVGLDARG